MISHLVDNLQALCRLRSLRLLQRRLQPCLRILGQRCRRGDGDRKLALVYRNELIEALDNTLRLDKTAVLREDCEEVFRDVGERSLLASALDLLEQLLQARRALGGGQRRVRDEGAKLGGSLDRARDVVQLALHLVEVGRSPGEGGGEDGVRVLEGDGARGTAPETGRGGGAKGGAQHGKECGLEKSGEDGGNGEEGLQRVAGEIRRPVGNARPGDFGTRA